MALTESNMLPLGTKAPDFKLIDTISNNSFNFDDVAGNKGTIVVFSCNHCPFVIHVNDQMVALANDYREKGIGMVVISSNDVENYPMDAPDKMSIVAKVLKYPFPYLYDATQSVAKAYDAACTPDFYIFDGDQNLYYRGRLDGSRPGNDVEINGDDMRNALDGLINGASAPEKQYPSAGCNIKWK